MYFLYDKTTKKSSLIIPRPTFNESTVFETLKRWLETKKA